MKKYFILTFIIFLSSNCFINPQNKISANVGYGYYLNNSENSLKVMGDKSYKSYVNYGFSYQRDDILGYDFLFEYNYHKMIKKNVIKFFRTGTESPDIIDTIGTDASLISHNFDFNYIGNIYSYLSYGIGPSFIIVNRIIKTEDSFMEGGTRSLYDNLASSGLGINGFIDFTVPLYESENYLFFTSKLKLRYTHSIWFDKGLRHLDDYK